MRKKSLLAVAVCTGALAGASASAALASEVIGPPGSLTPNEAATSHANSICVFSGLNDNPTSTDPENPGGIVQSYGFSVVSKGLKAFAPSPAKHVGASATPTGGLLRLSEIHWLASTQCRGQPSSTYPDDAPRYCVGDVGGERPLS